MSMTKYHITNASGSHAFVTKNDRGQITKLEITKITPQKDITGHNGIPIPQPTDIVYIPGTGRDGIPPLQNVFRCTQYGPERAPHIQLAEGCTENRFEVVPHEHRASARVMHPVMDVIESLLVSNTQLIGRSVIVNKDTLFVYFLNDLNENINAEVPLINSDHLCD